MTSKTIILCLLAATGAIQGVNALPSYDECIEKCQDNSFCETAFYEKATGACEQYDCLFEGSGPTAYTQYIKPESSSRCPSNIPFPIPGQGESTPSTSFVSATSPSSSTSGPVVELSTSISRATVPTKTQAPTAAATTSPVPASSTSTGAAPPSRWSRSGWDISAVTGVVGASFVLLFLT